jgi:hypothetical protein
MAEGISDNLKAHLDIEVDVTSLSDDDLMDEWTKAAELAEAAKDRCRAFSAEHQKRLAAAEDERLANKVPSDEDQTVGSVE